MTPSLFSVRVYPADTDHGGIVHHAEYLRYCEQARVDWFEQRYGSMADFCEQHSVLFVVKSMEANYFKPAHLYDKLIIETTAEQLRPTLLQFQQCVMHGDVCLFDARINLVCVDHQIKPRALPTND